MTDDDRSKYRNRKTASNAVRAFGVLLALAAFLALAGAAALAAVGVSLNRPGTGLSPGGDIFVVERGETGSGAASRLEAAGYIRSRLLFRALMVAKPGDLKAGTYRLERHMTTLDILDLLRSGREMLVKVTVPEGATRSAIARLLEEAGVVDAASFLAAKPSPNAFVDAKADSVEGYLYPDSYYFAKGSDAVKVLDTFLSTFESKLRSELPETASLSPAELRERVILASVVEREYRAADEAARIAGVFYNRLKRGMRLQSCATVVYLMTERRKLPHPERLFYADLEIDDPYNTYLYAGLPPGPICNPGLVALSAAVRPEPSAYLYFRLVDPAEGRHHFSETFDEHARAEALYVKGLGD